MNTNTPRTNAAARQHHPQDPVVIESKKLEMELNQARQERDELMQMLLEAQLQLEYLDEKQGMGTTASMIGKIESLLQKLKETKSEGVS